MNCAAALRALFLIGALTLCGCGDSGVPVAGADPAPPTSATPEKWVVSFAAAQFSQTGFSVPTSPTLQRPAVFVDRSLRLIVRPTRGGRSLRLRLSNTFGSGPVEIASVHIGLASAGASIIPGSQQPLLFEGGQTRIVLPVGAEATTLSADLPHDFGQNLAVSLYLSGTHIAPSGHRQTNQTSYLTPDRGGDVASAESGAAFTEPITTSYYLAAIEVESSDPRGSLVTIGDSITDGTGSTLDAHGSYPSQLAARLEQQSASPVQSIINSGIGSNRVLADGSFQGGPSLLERFERDVLAHPNVSHVILMEGTNDSAIPPRPSAQQIIAGLSTVASALRARGLKVYGGTLTPAGSSITHGDFNAVAIRAEVNDWIRAGSAFDGVLDFAGALADPANPDRLVPTFDSGDGLHPNDAGYAAMAELAEKALLAELTRATLTR